MSPGSIRDALASEWKGELREDDARAAADLVDRSWTAARQRWGVDLDSSEFARYLARTAAGVAGLRDALDRLHLEELYLACACANGAAGAIAAFEAAYAGDLRAAIRSIGVQSGDVDDVLQTVFEKLFVGEDARITVYDGRGSLYTWLRVIAVRSAVDRLRKHRRDAPLDEASLPNLADRQPNPELELIRDTYGAELRRALEAAVRDLTTRERNLLRYQVLHRLSIDEISRIYGVHRATAARWLVAARAGLVTAVGRDLRRRLAIGQAQLDSIVRALDTRLDFTLSRILGTTTGASQ